jgi:transposase InsO family protein
MSNRLHILNQYPEFTSRIYIRNVINYINSGYTNIPAQYDTEAKRRRFIEKFGLNTGFDTRQFNGVNYLIYRPNNDNNVELEVCYPDQRQAKLQTIYNDINKGLGLGINAFYSQVAMNYLNISKRVCAEFLKKQGDYQITRPIKKIINEPIMEANPNDRWAIDIIVLGDDYPKAQNGGKEYIFTCIDYFSGKCWARALSNRNNNNVNDDIPQAFISICDEADVRPRKLQCDSEFYKGAILRWCKTNRIKVIKTASYTPTANAKVERLNREVRKKMKALFVKNNNLIWFPFLQNICNNINNQKSSVTKMTPNQLWRDEIIDELSDDEDELPMTLKTDNYTLSQLYDRNRRLLSNKALRQIATSKVHDYDVGDFVRISLRALFSSQREVMKNRMGVSKIGITFTPEVYIIVKKNVDQDELKNTTYELIRPSLNGRQGDQDLEIRTSSQGRKPFVKFFGSDLQKVEFNGADTLPNDDANNNPKTRAETNIKHSSLVPNNRFRALYLNRIDKQWRNINNPNA